MAFYGPSYNRYSLERAIQIGDQVEVVESYLGKDVVLYTGKVIGFDNHKHTEGYTVLIQTNDPAIPTSVWTRPDELRIRQEA